MGAQVYHEKLIKNRLRCFRCFATHIGKAWGRGRSYL